MAARDWGRVVLHTFLFMSTAVVTLFAFGVLHLLASMMMLWVIVPSALLHMVSIFLALLLSAALLLWAHHRRWGWLQAVALGGFSVPAFLVVLMVLSPLLPHRPRQGDEEPNQRQSRVSPSGRYILSVPIERSRSRKGPLGFGMPYWYVTVSDPNGVLLYRDAQEEFQGIHNVYWTWDDQDRVWLYDSDDGTVYLYEWADGAWSRRTWGHDRTRHIEQEIVPPDALYPPYVSAGPVQNLAVWVQ